MQHFSQCAKNLRFADDLLSTFSRCHRIRMKSHLFCALLFGLVLLLLFIFIPLALVYSHLERLTELDRLDSASHDDDFSINGEFSCLMQII